ncbi:MAG: 1-acyl-sn-glycerol-3-phosphate acyltransferase [Deltaproteobacteria bacterium]|nr:1-acyl-sn-glycerol-3-phosphate acyltransferase [Deltaproteobacteria bacterium]
MTIGETQERRRTGDARQPLAGDDVPFTQVDPRRWTNRMMLRVGDALRAYHRHHVIGTEHLSAALHSGRPVILIGNHCLDITDPLMLTVAIYRNLGHLLRFIGHGNLFFTVPILRSLATDWGLIPNRHMEMAERVLEEERALMLYPGSGTEAILRSYRREPYRLKWYGKLGFVELAMRHDATVLFVAGLGLDEMYYQTDVPAPAALVRLGNAGDDAYYRGTRLQIGAAGLHILPGVAPWPVRVTHLISAPLRLPRGLDPNDRDALAAAQVALWAECQALLDRVVAERERESDLVDRTCRAATAVLRRFGI